MEALFISWCDSCACPECGLSFMLLLPLKKHITLHLAVLTCTVWSPLNVQQASMNVSGCHFFCMEEFSSTPLLHKHFYVRHHFVRLPLCCHLSHSNKIQWSIGSASTAIPPTSTFDIINQHNRIRGSTFRTVLV